MISMRTEHLNTQETLEHQELEPSPRDPRAPSVPRALRAPRVPVRQPSSQSAQAPYTIKKTLLTQGQRADKERPLHMNTDHS